MMKDGAENSPHTMMCLSLLLNRPDSVWVMSGLSQIKEKPFREAHNRFAYAAVATLSQSAGACWLASTILDCEKTEKTT